jgi:hypothetical protein
VEEVGEVD